MIFQKEKTFKIKTDIFTFDGNECIQAEIGKFKRLIFKCLYFYSIKYELYEGFFRSLGKLTNERSCIFFSTHKFNFFNLIQFVMKKQILGLLTAALTVFGLNAATDTVTNSLDSGPGSLRDVVASASAGDSIVFAATTNGVPIVLASGEISFSKSLYIIGNGPTTTTINGSAMGRIFNISNAGTSSLENLGLSNGNATIGGAVLSSMTTLDIVNCRLNNNTATGPMATDGGGALYVIDGTVSVDSSEFFLNTATGASGSGGAIWSNGDLTVSNSSIRLNQANRAGGGIEIGGSATSVTTLSKTNLDSNSVSLSTASPGNGGGLHITGPGMVSVDKGTVNGNTAASEGGGLWNNQGQMDIDGTIIKDNIASGDMSTNGGGGVFNNGGYVEISAAVIQNNRADGTAGSGGGIFSVADTVFVRQSFITNNSANRAGGGIEVIDGKVHLDTVSLDNNDVDGTAGTPNPGNGGGLHVSGIATVVMIGGTANGNDAASEGGGLWNQANSTMNIDGVILFGNTANGTAADNGGGGLFNNGGTLNVTDASITGNNVPNGSGSGGGILNDGGTLNVTNSDVSKNTAQRAGGGIEDANGMVTVTNSTLDSNDAGSSPGNGGGLHSGGGTVDVIGGTVNGNTAIEGGGLWSSGTMTVDSTLIDGNIALSDTDAAFEGGGGVFNQGGDVTISNATISNNTADNMAGSGGGIFNNGMATLTVINTTIEDNSSVRAGGGIEVNGGTVDLDDVDFTDNMTGATPGNGGALHITKGTVNANGGVVSGNTAASEGGGFWNNAGWTMTVDSVTFMNNTASGNAADNGGGGLFNNGGTLIVNNSEIRGNMADGTSGSGGGILNDTAGTLTVTNTTIAENSAVRAGGGIEDASFGSTVTNLTNVFLDTNSVASNPGNGGGMHVTGAGDVNITGGRVKGNTASSEGGGLWNHKGTMTVDSVMIAFNTASGNTGSEGGGGIYNLTGGTLMVMKSVIHDNDADGTSGSGGGILNDSGATLDVAHSNIFGNTANRAGGGIEDAGGTVTVTMTTLDDNDAGSNPGNGGGLHTGGGDVTFERSTASNNNAMEGGGLWSSGTMDVKVSTVSNNTSVNDGGGIYNKANTTTVTSSTVSDNNAGGTGGGIDITSVPSITVVLNNTIVANNSASGGGNDLNTSGGVYVSNGFNLIEDDDANVFTPMSSDIEGQDPNLGALADNGGKTETHALMCPSPAVNAGDPSITMDDQRGLPVFGGQRDIGSFELQSVCPGDTNNNQGACGAVVVSDSNFRKSTFVRMSNNQGAWNGVNGMLPDSSTFTLPAMEGQPFSFPTIDAVDSAKVIKTENNITFFRQTFTLNNPSNSSARVRLNVDDQAEIYVNGKLLAADYTFGQTSRRNPATDAMINDDNTVDNPNGGGDAFDSVTTMDLDNIFVDGQNEVILAVRNFARANDRGGFSFRLDVDCEADTVINQLTKDSCVSDTSWRRSTVVTQSSLSGQWMGTNGLPADSTFTLPVDTGQPYGFRSIVRVPGSHVIKSENNIRYFRKTFDLTESDDLDARFRATFDDQVEIYVNGIKLLRENTVGANNDQLPPHDIAFDGTSKTFVNGNAGGNMYDFVGTNDLDSVFQTGTNTLTVALRNFSKASDRGGFSFRLDVSKGGQSVLVRKEAVYASVQVEEALVEAFPNPTNGKLTLLLPVLTDAQTAEVAIYNLSGAQVHQFERTAGDRPVVELDLTTQPDGVYILRYISGGEVITQKIVKR